jgi:thymidylate kinase
VEQWFDCPPDDWRPLGPIMYARKKFGAALLFQEAKRVLKRVMNPTGVSVAILGLDDAARKSLVARLEELLQPCFRYQPLHFRPRGHETSQNGIANPLKAFFYFLNYLVEWWRVVVPARISSHFVVCEGSFDELLINAEQAGTKGEKNFARFLQSLLPRPDQTFVLLTPVSLSQQRHPGSAKDEWERQERGLLRLAADQRYYTKISAEESPEELARHIWREVVNGMAVREARRA